MLEESARELFRNELNPEEKIVWVGRPRQGIYLRSGDIILIPFNLIGMGIMSFAFLAIVSDAPPPFFWLLGIPIILAWGYMFIGRFFVSMAQRRKTHYCITNERIIILSNFFNKNVKSLSLRNLPEMNLDDRNDGRGTITFGSSTLAVQVYSGSGIPSTGRYKIPPSFEMIDDAKQVYQLITHVQVEKA